MTYAPSAAVQGSVASAALPYFEVGLGKFVTMSLVTWGIYEFFWAYQQWKRIKLRSSEDLSPFWRAFFANFWGFSLFRHVRSDAMSQQIAIDWAPGFLGLAYLVMLSLWRLPDPWWLISLFSFLPMMPVVQAITALNDKVAPSRERNSRFSGANIAGVIIGGLFLLLVLVGMATS